MVAAPLFQGVAGGGRHQGPDGKSGHSDAWLSRDNSRGNRRRIGDSRGTGFAEAVEELPAVVEVDRAGISEVELPGGPVKQLRFQLRLQTRHQPADMGAADAQSPRCTGE